MRQTALTGLGREGLLESRGKPRTYPLVYGDSGGIMSAVFPPRDTGHGEPVQRCQHQRPLLGLQARHLLLLEILAARKDTFSLFIIPGEGWNAF